MSKKPNKIVGFINKTFSIKQNAVWKGQDYAASLCDAARYVTYLETVNAPDMPNADTLHYRIENDTTVKTLCENFLSLTKKQLRKLRKRRAIVIIDYTYEPFFGITLNRWIHLYKPAAGCRGCYKILAASIVVDEQRYFVYAKPIHVLADETAELEKVLLHIKELGLRIKVVLIDRGLARSSENLALLNAMHVKYLGLYPKYKNIKKIIENMKRGTINRKFKVRSVETRLIIGKTKFMWVFATNLVYKEFLTYVRLYKKRWNIETGFRVHDETTIKTKSVDIRVRFFLFLIGLLLYNVWKLLGCAASFKRFIINIKWGVSYEQRKPT